MYLKQVRMTYSINTSEMAALLKWLREAREASGLSMRDLACRLGKPHSYVQKVESGERRLDVVEFVWYCRAVGQPARNGLAVVERMGCSASDEDPVAAEA